jgi:hypothetical protein
MGFENELGTIPQSSCDDDNGKQEQTKHLTKIEFNSGKTKIIAMPPIIASSRFPNKPKLLDQRVKASLTRHE